MTPELPVHLIEFPSGASARPQDVVYIQPESRGRGGILENFEGTTPDLVFIGFEHKTPERILCESFEEAQQTAREWTAKINAAVRAQQLASAPAEPSEPPYCQAALKLVLKAKCKDDVYVNLTRIMDLEPAVAQILWRALTREAGPGYSNLGAVRELKGEIQSHVGFFAKNPALRDSKDWNAVMYTVYDLLPPEEEPAAAEMSHHD